jgi:hypothetical protein
MRCTPLLRASPAWPSPIRFPRKARVTPGACCLDDITKIDFYEQQITSLRGNGNDYRVLTPTENQGAVNVSS